VAVGLSLFAGGLGAMAHSRWIEFQDRKAFENLVSSYPPSGDSPREGSSVAIVNIPRLNLSVLVRSGVSTDVLSRGAGWIPGTALPGTRGNAAIAAHRDSFFRPLRDVQTGDLITVDSNGHKYSYRVSSLDVVAPTATETLKPTEVPSLTLITCYPFSYLGAAPERFIVKATAVRS